MDRLTKGEQELLQILWDAGEPLSRGGILKKAKEMGCSWKPTSVHILINSLLEKQLIRVAGIAQDSRSLGRTYQAVVTRQDYALAQVELALKDAGSLAGMDEKALLEKVRENGDG